MSREETGSEGHAMTPEDQEDEVMISLFITGPDQGVSIWGDGNQLAYAQTSDPAAAIREALTKAGLLELFREATR